MRVSSVVKSHRWQYPVLGPTHFGPQHSAVRIWSSVGRSMLPPFYLKKKAACVATSGPSLGRKRAQEGSDSGVALGGDRYRMPLPKTIAIGGSIERREAPGI